MNRKILMLLSAALMSIQLTGCNNNYEDDSISYDVSEAIKADGQAYTEIEDENVTEISVFKNDWADFNNARKNNSPVYSKLKSKIGCDIEGMNSSSATWESQISLLQADEDLPDIFLTKGPENSHFFQRLIENGDALPISDWVNEEHYPNIYNYIRQYDFLRYNVTYGQGKMWFIPSAWHNEKSLYVRTDWIDNLNAKLDSILVKEKIVNSTAEITDAIREQWKYKLPDNLLEFYRLARAFTIYDPDNNGQNDTCGYMSESNKDMDSWIYIAFDTGWAEFVKDGDVYVPSDVTDGSKYATAFITRLISEGYMSIDSLTADNETKQRKFMNGQTGMMFAHNWYNVILSGLISSQKCTQAEAREKFTIIEPPCGKNGSHGGHGQTAFWEGFCINANMSNARIRKCLEFYDYLLSDEGYDLLQYGVEGVHYKQNEDGTRTSLLPTDDDGISPFLMNVDSATLLYALVEWTMQYKSTLLSNSDIIIPRERVSEQNSSFADYPYVTTPSYVDYYSDCYDLFLETISVLEKNEKNLFYEPSDSTNYNPTTFGWDDLYDLSRSFTNKWNGFVKSYKSDAYSGQTIINEVNEYINSGKAMKVSKDDYIFR